jgi:hypothetical protein
MARIQISEDAGAVALASILSEVLATNLEEKPQRVKDLNRMKAKVGILARDADVAITFCFLKGNVIVQDGLTADSKLILNAPTDTLMELTNLNIKFGIPWFFDKTGLSVVKKLLTRELQIMGLLTHPFLLIRVAKVMSVA